MNKTIKYTIFMVVLGIIISFALAFINEITSPIIEKQKIEKVKESLLEVDSVNTWETYSNYINISEDEFIEEVYISKTNNNEIKYFAYLVNTKGYSNGKIESIVFINNDEKNISKVKIISIENQTKGIGYYLNFINFTNLDEVTEYAIESEQVEFKYLKQVYAVKFDLDFDYIPSREEFFKNLDITYDFN